MRIWFTAFLLAAVPASAQVVVAPASMTFTHAAADFNVTASYRLEFFQCSSLNAGACVGRAATPFQAGASVPKSAVTRLVSESGLSRLSNV